MTRMRGKKTRYRTAAFAVIALLSFTVGCIPIPVPKPQPPARVERIENALADCAELTVAPYYNNDEIDEFGEALLDAGATIEFVASAELWRAVFPDRPPDADATLLELLDPSNRERIERQRIDFIVVLSPVKTREESSDSMTFFLLGFHWSKRKWTHGQLRLVQIAHSVGTVPRLNGLNSKASGTITVTWLPVWFLMFVYFETEADTHESAVEGLAKAVADRIAASESENDPKRLVILSTAN